jgi:hypothetical protein
VIVSRHVIFDESQFSFAVAKPPTKSLDFLLQDRLPAPISTVASSGSSSSARPVYDDALELDPAILWHRPVLQAPALATIGPSPAAPIGPLSAAATDDSLPAAGVTAGRQVGRSAPSAA